LCHLNSGSSELTCTFGNSSRHGAGRIFFLCLIKFRPHLYIGV